MAPSCKERASSSSQMRISSIRFDDGSMIPKQYGCEGQDRSPPLSIENVPERAKSLVLILSDPDVPSGNYIHWIAYDIPPDTIHLSQGITPQHQGFLQGQNSANRTGYKGPCPPSGIHRYRFLLYAIDKEKLGLEEGASINELYDAIKGHTIADAELLGRYQKGNP